MQKITLLCSLLLIATSARSQETFTLSGGVVVANAIDYSGAYNEDYHTSANGFRITGTYEVGPLESKKFIHGVSASYILSTATANLYGQETDISVRTLPFCYAPKYLIGSEKAMAFARAAVGVHFTRITVEGGSVDGGDNDWGFYGGLGAGGMVYVGKTVFLNLDYELAWMSHTYYANGYLHSVQLGIGMDF